MKHTFLDFFSGIYDVTTEKRIRGRNGCIASAFSQPDCEVAYNRVLRVEFSAEFNGSLIFFLISLHLLRPLCPFLFHKEIIYSLIPFFIWTKFAREKSRDVNGASLQFMHDSILEQTLQIVHSFPVGVLRNFRASRLNYRHL